MANNGNLKRGNPETQFHKGRGNGRGAVENAEKSVAARKAKKDLKERLKMALEMPADPSVAKALSKTGIEVEDNLDVVVASMMKGVMKSNPHIIDKLLKLMDYDPKEANRKEMFEIEKQKAELEVIKMELEAERQRLWLEALKAQQGQGEELPDDGFIDALSGTAAEDWNDDEDI